MRLHKYECTTPCADMKILRRTIAKGREWHGLHVRAFAKLRLLNRS